MNTQLAQTPEPPYYAVIFTSQRTDGDNGYEEMAVRMVELAKQQPGFLGIESVRGADGLGITAAYFDSLDAIKIWKANADHRIAQKRGREEWYSAFKLRVCKVEREYGMERVS